MRLFNEQMKWSKIKQTAEYKIAKAVMQQGKHTVQKWEMKKGQDHICR